MTLTAERDWWVTSAIRDDIWGIGTWEEGVVACAEQLAWMFAHRGRILDLGCGPGRLLIPFARTYPGATWVGLDVRLYPAPQEPNVVWLVGDGESVPLTSGSLTGAYSVAVFQHLPHEVTRGYLTEIARCLRPGGRLCFQHVIGTEDSFLSHQADPELLATWCREAGLVVESCEVGAVHYQWVWVRAVRP